MLLLLNYLLPLGFYAMLGLLMTEINPTFRETMIAAMVVFASMSSMLLGLPDPLVTAREAGIFRSYKINGVPAVSILAIPALTTILHLVIVTIVITATAPLFFDAPLPVNWLSYALVFFLTAFACAGLGVLIGVVSSSSRMTVLWSQLIYLPSMIVGGLMIPYGMLPPAMRRVAQLLPATHAMNAFRGLAQGLPADFDPLGSLIVLLASGVLAFALAVWLFNWDSHNRTQRGHPLLGLLALLPYALGVLFLS
jgi:ABC-2 type transport system permease protein